ncbi:DUF2283 domain-containing protein [Crenothrix sp.]|uniref:DUF2283 domain-containing protein n=1 Tax=Crenothrix sp. TaxID=3100433 RepID=UPI00374DBCCF
MKLNIDEVADALHLQLVEAEVVESEEIAAGIILDYDAAGEVVGLEVLYLSKRHHPIDLLDFQFQTHRKPSNASTTASVVA